MKRSWVVFWFVLLAGCGVADEGTGSANDPIVGGTPDRDRDPAVVALETDDGALCSGSLVTPRAVLTARHCVSFTEEALDCGRPGRQVFGDRDPSSIHVIGRSDVRAGVELARGERIVVPRSDRVCGMDLAVVLLDRPVTDIAPLRPAAHDALARGHTLRVVGFGLTSDRGRAHVGVRYRRDAVPVIDVGTREFAIGEGVCSGDSGGPAIDPATGAIVGVLSRGGGGCEGARAVNVFTRVAPYAAWIESASR